MEATLGWALSGVWAGVVERSGWSHGLAEERCRYQAEAGGRGVRGWAAGGWSRCLRLTPTLEITRRIRFEVEQSRNTKIRAWTPHSNSKSISTIHVCNVHFPNMFWTFSPASNFGYDRVCKLLNHVRSDFYFGVWKGWWLRQDGSRASEHCLRHFNIIELDIFKETSGQFPPMFVVTKPDILSQNINQLSVFWGPNLTRTQLQHCQNIKLKIESKETCSTMEMVRLPVKNSWLWSPQFIIHLAALL